MGHLFPAGIAGACAARINRQSALASAAIIDESWSGSGVATGRPSGPGLSVARRKSMRSSLAGRSLPRTAWSEAADEAALFERRDQAVDARF